MYLCNNCGVTFDEPHQGVIYHDEVDFQKEEYYSVCPRCEENDFDEVVTCKMCDDFIVKNETEKYVAFNNGDNVCNDCLHDYCKERFGA